MTAPDPRTRFTGRVDDYVRYRPRYPAGVVDVLREETGLAPDWVVADVGSGTGFSAEPFLDFGNTVFAVEPNAAMRAAAESQYGRNPRFHSVGGSAEDTGLEPGSVDLVVAGQAFHWFDRAAAGEHFRAILRGPGRVALLWNTRRTGASPFMRAFEELLERFGTDYAAVRHDRLPDDALDDFFRGGRARRSLPNAQVLDLAGLEGRLRSTSYTPGPDDPRRAAMLERAHEIFDRYQEEGTVRMEYETEIHVGRVMV